MILKVLMLKKLAQGYSFRILTQGSVFGAQTSVLSLTPYCPSEKKKGDILTPNFNESDRNQYAFSFE